MTVSDRAAADKDEKRPFDLANGRFYGANDGIRTHDLLITNQLLCQLSHISILTFDVNCGTISSSEIDYTTFFPTCQDVFIFFYTGGSFF